MPAASILIKPASANCNMDCQYCFYKCLSSNREEYSKGFMSEETLEKLIRNAITYGEGLLTFAFQGGEPTLAGLDFFKKAVALQKEYGKEKPNLRIENTLQTNATLLDEEWCEFFRQENFLLGVSLDGPRKVHDDARLMGSHKPSFEIVMKNISLLKKFRVDFNILTVVTEELSHKASALYSFYKRNGFDYVQLIPCMDEEQRQSMSGGHNPYAVKPQSYGRFLCEFFDLWYEDFIRGDIMDVRMFSNLAQMSVGYPSEECGMCGHCNCYFVVEGDGSVYPCDFYCMDEYKIGTVENGFQQLRETQIVRDFEEISYEKSPECEECEHYSLCRGGCRRFREPFIGGKPQLNYLCPGYKMFFSHTKERIYRLGKTITI